MLIQKPDVLAQALRPFLKDQVVIRYSAAYRSGLNFHAQLALLLHRENRDYLVRVGISVTISHHTKDVDIGSDYVTINLCDRPSAIEEMCTQWSERLFDDWMHEKPFMGAYGIFLDEVPHTSVKWDASKDHWRFLTGVVIAELEKHRLVKLTATPKDESVLEGIVLIQRRFSAFAAQTELAWARRELVL